MDDDVQSDDDIINWARQNIASLNKAVLEFIKFRKFNNPNSYKHKLLQNKTNKYIRNLRYNL